MKEGVIRIFSSRGPLGHPVSELLLPMSELPAELSTIALGKKAMAEAVINRITARETNFERKVEPFNLGR